MIRPAGEGDLPRILKIYENARKFMAENGNPTQWGNHFPPREWLENDIARHQLFVLEEEGVVHGVFAYLLGEDPTYQKIIEGRWISDAPYGAIHRVASDGQIRGLLEKAVAFCTEIEPHIRIDTHEANKIMQRAIEKNGFQKCGIIFAEDNTPRIAYEKV